MSINLGTINQPPYNIPITTSNGIVTPQWQFWLQQFSTFQNNIIPIITIDNVVNGSYDSIGQVTLYIGLDSDRPATPTGSEVYFAYDSGVIYTGLSGIWYSQIPIYSGDVYNTSTSPNTLTLSNVLTNPGTYSDAILTVNAKGQVVAISGGLGPTAAGASNDVQFNEGGLFTADTGFFEYDSTIHVLDATNPTKNLIDRPVTVPVDTSYIVDSYLTIADVLTIEGIVDVLGGDTLGDSGVTAGSYTLANITVNSEGVITAASSNTITSIVNSLNTTGSGIGLSASTGDIVITNTGVTSLNAGSGISLSGGTGDIVITNTGVTSISSTDSNIVYSNYTGDVQTTIPVMSYTTISIPASTDGGGYGRLSLGDNSGVHSDFSNAFGWTAQAYGQQSMAIGYEALAYGEYAFALGNGTDARGYASCAISGGAGGALGPGASAIPDYSVGIGFQAYPFLPGEVNFSGHEITSLISFYGLSITTADATPAVMRYFNTNTATDCFFVLNDNNTYFLNVTVLAQNTDTFADQAMWEIKLCAARGTGPSTATIVGIPTGTGAPLFSTLGASTWTVSVAADTTFGGPTFTVTGAASTNISWSATIIFNRIYLTY